jgi:hypothetical protein
VRSGSWHGLLGGRWMIYLPDVGVGKSFFATIKIAIFEIGRIWRGGFLAVAPRSGG